MRIGLFSDCYHPTKNGVTTALAQLKAGLAARGHRVLLFTVAMPGHVETELDIYRFPSLPFDATIGLRLGMVSQQAINQRVRAERLELLHTHTEFSLARAAQRAARQFDLPLVHTLHTHYEDYRHYLPLGRFIPRAWVRRWLLRRLRDYAAIICPSAKMQRYLQQHAPALPTTVIGNGLDLTRFAPTRLTPADLARARAALGVAPAERVLLNVGRLAPEKRVLPLLEALAPLLHHQPEVILALVGDGSQRAALTRQAERLGVASQLRLPGYLPWKQLPAVYACAQAYVTASLSEIHPMTVLEAIASGLPIVARRDPAYADLVKDGYNGYLADTDVAMAQRVTALLADATRRVELAHNARALAAQFNLDAQAEQMATLYSALTR